MKSSFLGLLVQFASLLAAESFVAGRTRRHLQGREDNVSRIRIVRRPEPIPCVGSHAKVGMSRPSKSRLPRSRLHVQAKGSVAVAARYKIIEETRVVDSTALDSQKVALLLPGVVVSVVEVVVMPEVQRVRARIQNPEGWISLINTANGFRWAQKQADHWQDVQLSQLPNCRGRSEPKAGSVTILSGSNSEREWSAHVRENHKLFAESHGYRYEYAHVPEWKNASTDKEPQWLKVRALLECLRGTDSEYVLWVDDDIVFTTKSDFVSSMAKDMHGKSLLIARDIRLDQVNTGIMLFRRGSESMEILGRMWEASSSRLGYCRDQSCFHEQESLNALIKRKVVNAHVVNPVNELYNLNTMWRSSHYDEARKNAYTGRRLYLNYNEEDPPGQRWRWGMNMAHVSGMTPSCRAPMLKWISEYTKQFVFGFGALNGSMDGPYNVQCKVHLRQKSMWEALRQSLPEWVAEPLPGDQPHFGSNLQMTNLDLEVNYSSKGVSSLGPTEGHNFTVRLTGKLIVQDEGEYEFFTLSGNGSQLTIDGTQIANSNEVHSVRIHSGKASLSAGHHNISLEFSEIRENDAGMMFSFRGANLESQSIVLPSFASWHNDVWNGTSPFSRPTCPSQLSLSLLEVEHPHKLPTAARSSRFPFAASMVLLVVALSMKLHAAFASHLGDAVSQDMGEHQKVSVSKSSTDSPLPCVTTASSSALDEQEWLLVESAVAEGVE